MPCLLRREAVSWAPAQARITRTRFRFDIHPPTRPEPLGATGFAVESSGRVTTVAGETAFIPDRASRQLELERAATRPRLRQL